MIHRRKISIYQVTEYLGNISIHLFLFVKSFVKLKFQTQDGRADMTNFEMDLFDTKINSYALEKVCLSSCLQFCEGSTKRLTMVILVSLHF